MTPSVRTPSIRDATDADVAALQRIYNREVREGAATFDVETRSLEEQGRWLVDRSVGHVVLVAEIEREVVGFGSLSAFRLRAAYRPTVENSVYVDPPFQRLGVGRALLAELIDRARKHGYHSVIARIAGSNAGSIALHETLGFEMVGVEREVGRKFGRWIDLTEMQLML